MIEMPGHQRLRCWPAPARRARSTTGAPAFRACHGSDARGGIAGGRGPGSHEPALKEAAGAPDRRGRSGQQNGDRRAFAVIGGW